MIALAVDLCNSVAVTLFGIALSAAFCNIHWTPKAKKRMLLYTLMIFCLSGIAYLGVDPGFGRYLYPLHTHLPLVLALCSLSHERLWPVISVLTAYLCCQLRRWLALIAVAIFSGGDTMQYAVEIIVTVPLLILLLIPLTLFVGVYYFAGRKYYFISLLILLECMLPFFLIFEGRKPQARELVPIAVMSALAVVGRTVFSIVPLPNFKPVSAIVIITAVAFGPETGFLTGALTGFLSNFIFGQGPWTPWQMFAMGLIGFLGGVCFHNGPLRQSRLSLAIFGAVCSVLVYGGIMNPSTALIWARTLDWKVLLSYYLTGIPWDLVRGAATALFLWFGAEPMLEKLERIQIKYGLMEHRENAER